MLCQVALEELQDLKGVWSELSKVWEQIDQMKEQPWVSVQPRKVSDAPAVSFDARLRVCFTDSMFSFRTAASELGRPPQPAEELPRSSAAVRLVRVCAATAQRIHEGELVLHRAGHTSDETLLCEALKLLQNICFEPVIWSVCQTVKVT